MSQMLKYRACFPCKGEVDSFTLISINIQRTLLYSYKVECDDIGFLEIWKRNLVKKYI